MPTLTTQPSLELAEKKIKLIDEILALKELQYNSPALTIRKIEHSPQSAQQIRERQHFQTRQNSAQEESSISAPSFQILNQDYLAQASSTKITTKPNAIVRPVRREKIEEPNTGQQHSQNLESEELQQNNDNLRRSSKTDSSSNLFTNFAKELDIRLRRLRKTPLSSKNSSTQDSLANRPLFYTTVPRGIFLEPVKEQTIPSKRIYAYYSRPRIFTNNVKCIENDNDTTDNPKSDNFLDKKVTNTFDSISPRHTRKRRDTQQQQQQTSSQYRNLMYDKRVIRGSNYSQTQFGAGDADQYLRESERRKHLIKKRQIQTRNLRNVIGTPPPVYGRKHEDVQTEKYLEELFDRPPTQETFAQTDLYLQKPITPPYVPGKIGIDQGTEILEGELFDFDTEVDPIIDTLVGCTIEQSLIEVMHEEEILNLKRQQQEFLAQREAELAELRRLEAEEICIQEEKQRRLQQDQITQQLEIEMEEQITAAKLLQGYIANILPGVLSNLEPLAEIANRENLEKELCPWLSKEVAEEVGHIIDSREILLEIIKEILVERASKYNENFSTIEETESELNIIEETESNETKSYNVTTEAIDTEESKEEDKN